MTRGHIARSVSQPHLGPSDSLGKPTLSPSKLFLRLRCMRFPPRIEGYRTFHDQQSPAKAVHKCARQISLDLSASSPWNLNSLALRSGNPEGRSVTGLPIVLPAVERLKPPPFPGPVGSDGKIAIVDFLHQLPHRLPAEVKCDLCSNVQIDS